MHSTPEIIALFATVFGLAILSDISRCLRKVERQLAEKAKEPSQA